MSPLVIRGRVLDLLRPAPGRLGFTLRMALVCAIITLVIETYQLPSLATTVYVAFFILKGDRGATIVASIVMPIVLTIALLITLLLTATILDHPFWRVMTMALFSFTILFLGSASKLKPIAATYAVVVGYTLDLLGGLQVGELATRAILYTWLVIGIPAGVCLAVAMVTGPSPRRLLERALAARLRASANLLEFGGEPGTIETLLQKGDAELRELLKSAKSEHDFRGADAAALARAIDSTMAILSYSLLLAQTPPDAMTAQGRCQIAAVLEEMAGILGQGGYPIGIVAPVFDPALICAHTARLFGLLGAELAGFAEGPIAAPVEKSGGFMKPDAFTNPAHVRYALKTTGAAMFCYLMFQQLDWTGIHTSMITCFVVSLGSAAETVEKLTLRLCGCLIGATLGFGALIFVLPNIDGIVPLVFVIVLGTLPAAWVAAGGPRIAYAGLQMAFAFYLIVLQGASPAYDLALGRDRIIGVIFGNIVVFLVFTKVWPVSISAEIDPAIARVLHALAGLATAGRQEARQRIGAVRNAAGGLHQNLRIAQYEPSSIRPSAGWLDDRAKALAQIDTLQAPLLMAASSGNERVSMAGRILHALASRLEEAAERPVNHRRVSLAPKLAALDRVLATTDEKGTFHARG